MNTLVIGRCPKTVEQFSTFCGNVIIALDNSFTRERHLPELENYTIEYCKSNIKSVKGILPRTKEIIHLVKKHDIDVIFSNTKWDMVAAKIASIFIRKKIFLFATNHNSYAWQNQSDVRKMSFLIKYTTDCYVALASFVYEKLKELGLENKLIMIPNTVGYETWEVKEDYSYNKTFKMIYVAYICPGKHQDMIADILNLLKNKYDIIVDCYGDTDEYTDFINTINKKIENLQLVGKLNFKGKIENLQLRSILKEYDAYISVSRMEMSPVNILEAQAAGLPIIASKVGGVPDIINEGKTGLLFEIDNPNSAAEKIELLINNKTLRENLGRAGRAYVSKEYTKIQAGNRLQSVINKKFNKK